MSTPYDEFFPILINFFKQKQKTAEDIDPYSRTVKCVAKLLAEELGAIISDINSGIYDDEQVAED